MKVGDFRQDESFSYNDRGDVVRTVIHRSGGFAGMPDVDDQHESEYVYAYDDHGNWIEQKTRTLGKAGEPISGENVRRRVLAYF